MQIENLNEFLIMTMESYVMYFIFNTSLSMKTGKKCSQVVHACRRLIEKIEHHHDNKLIINYLQWKKTGAKTVVLKASEEYLRHLINISNNDTIYIIDAGLTQIEQNSLTVVGIFTKVGDARINDLKLL